MSEASVPAIAEKGHEPAEVPQRAVQYNLMVWAGERLFRMVGLMLHMATSVIG